MLEARHSRFALRASNLELDSQSGMVNGAPPLAW